MINKPKPMNAKNNNPQIINKPILERFLSSLDTYSKGFDGRKLSAMGVISTAMSIGITYAYCLIIGKFVFDIYGVFLVIGLLLFGALYLSIIDGEQLENILTSKNTTTVIEKHDGSESYQKKDSYEPNDALKGDGDNSNQSEDGVVK